MKAQDYKHLYKTARWQKFRAAFLRANPLCLMCKDKDNRIGEATIADHIKPHKGDLTLFWDINNIQPLCKTHHDSDKRLLETTGRVRKTIGIDGYPIE